LSSLKSDCSLFSSLYISCQTREGDIDKFFARENQACPPSLLNMGKLRLGTKSDVVGCKEKLVPSTTRENSLPDVQPCHVPTVDADVVWDNPAYGSARTCDSSATSNTIIIQFSKTLVTQ